MGAGIVVFKMIEGEYKVLCLYEENDAGIRKYDLTKGSIDKGETALETAIRETYEESGISDLYFRWGKSFLKSGGITMFLAETNDNAIIQKNPVTGKLEHSGFEWNYPDVAYVLMPEYLKPFVSWARDKIKGDKNVKI